MVCKEFNPANNHMSELGKAQVSHTWIPDTETGNAVVLSH